MDIKAVTVFMSINQSPSESPMSTYRLPTIQPLSPPVSAVWPSHEFEDRNDIDPTWFDAHSVAYKREFMSRHWVNISLNQHNLARAARLLRALQFTPDDPSPINVLQVSFVLSKPHERGVALKSMETLSEIISMSPGIHTLFISEFMGDSWSFEMPTSGPGLGKNLKIIRLRHIDITNWSHLASFLLRIPCLETLEIEQVRVLVPHSDPPLEHIVLATLRNLKITVLPTADKTLVENLVLPNLTTLAISGQAEGDADVNMVISLLERNHNLKMLDLVGWLNCKCLMSNYVCTNICCRVRIFSTGRRRANRA